MIENTDQRSQDYSAIKDVFRPGHADYTYEQKYGLRDYRGGGRSSARETAMRVAAGAIAKKYLAEKFGIEIRGCLTQMGDIPLDIKDWSQVEQNPFFCPDPDKIDALDELMRALKKEGDSIGAKVTVVASGVPAGLGEPVFDRLDADIAHALMSINAVKGVGKLATAVTWWRCAAARTAMKSPKTVSRATMRAAFSAVSAADANHCPYGAETDLQHYRAGSYH